MWSPGTFLHVKGKHIEDVFDRGDKRSWKRAEQNTKTRFGLVISVRETGYGTKGPKWDALILSHGRLIELRDAWQLEDMFIVHRIATND